MGKKAHYCDRCGKRKWITDPIYMRFDEQGNPRDEYCTCDGPLPTVSEILESRKAEGRRNLEDIDEWLGGKD